MDSEFANLLSAEVAGISTAALLLAAGGAYGVRAYLRNRPTPAELERRRRVMLHATGKMGDATVTELRESIVFYSYDVRGVEYNATQDLSDLLPSLPPEVLAAIGLGAVSVKYDPRNPANSIVLSENWSGLRTPQPRR
jgi:hypothetical protein